MKKRLLSLALAICMVAAMLPTFAVSASALEVNETISYYFCAHTTNSDIPSKGAINAYATNYNETTGRYWRFKKASDNNAAKSAVMTGRINGDTRNVNKYIALEISVPEDGTYKTEYSYYKMYNKGTIQGGKGDVYILPGNTSLPSGTNTTIKSADVATKYNGKIIASNVDYSAGDASTEGEVEVPVVEENIELKKGDNILLFVVTDKGANANTGGNYDYYTFPTSLTLTLTAKAPAEDTDLKTAFTPDDTTDVDATVYTDKVEALPYVDGAEAAEGVTATAKQLADGTYQMSTSTTDKENTFLYWVKGLDGGAKRVVSREQSFVYTPAGNVVNYLIAVYEKNGATTPKAEFYNANGLLYKTVEEASGTTPELPSMAGYGTAKHWVAKDGTTYAGNAPITVSETMMLVAEYDDPTEDITVTTDENCTTNKPGKKYAYGEKVICTPTENGTGTFYAWTKGGEIVSTDPEKYEFYAWEDCTVNAVYKEHTPITSVARKIIIDVFGNNVMAEFIGFGDAVEKGIILDNTKITMTSKKSQFTVELGEATSAKGYAVVKNTDGTYTEYIDGSYPTTEQE
ncbi:MAG: hypothetical protein IJP38_06960 [Oscillospiraceae bacterium]|nr:hypothetical protein [Oscillospiraceae bacterium]MBQ9986033.1 hypothetical protein [Oscillospiraceae bacterium]